MFLTFKNEPISQRLNIYLSENHVNYHDYTGFYSPSFYHVDIFSRVESKEAYQTHSENNKARVYFRMSNSKNRYTRTAYTMTDAMGAIGGMKSCMILVANFIVFTLINLEAFSRYCFEQINGVDKSSINHQVTKAIINKLKQKKTSKQRRSSLNPPQNTTF